MTPPDPSSQQTPLAAVSDDVRVLEYAPPAQRLPAGRLSQVMIGMCIGLMMVAAGVILGGVGVVMFLFFRDMDANAVTGLVVFVAVGGALLWAGLDSFRESRSRFHQLQLELKAKQQSNVRRDDSH